jgi:hypothetical protein
MDRRLVMQKRVQVVGRCLIASLAGACSIESGTGTDPLPTYYESEPNDFAFEADAFGVVFPGDHFLIRGYISDVPWNPFDPFNGFDPYDGLAFTSGLPLRVDFLLYADDPFADLDVCVFDPWAGWTVDCFATGVDPEVGSVDVLAGGVDFHLVVESFVGSSSYTLEILASPYLPLQASAPEDESESGTLVRARGDGSEYARAANARAGPAYGRREPRRSDRAPASDATRAESGELSNDRWMGIQGELRDP